MKLQDKVALITGAGQGIGRAIAVLSAGQGARVALVERNETTGRETQEQIKSKGGEASLLVLDITEPGSAAAAVNQVRDAWGRVDILVNNAGFDRPGGIFKIRD